MYQDSFKTFPVLETERLILRQLTEDDAPPIFEYASDPDLQKFTDLFPTTLEEINTVIKIWNNEAYNSQSFIRWCIALKDNNLCIGGVYLFMPVGDDISGRRMDIGYDLSPKYRNKGYASEAITRVCKHAFEDMGLVRIQAQCIPENMASIRASEKSGFKNEGVFKNYCHYISKNEMKTMTIMSICR